MLNRLPDGLSDDVIRWAVLELIDHRVDNSKALAEAVEVGKREGIFQVRREQLKPVANQIIQAAIGGEGA